MNTKKKIIIGARTSWHFQNSFTKTEILILKENFDITFTFMDVKSSTTNQTEEFDFYKISVDQKVCTKNSLIGLISRIGYFSNEILSNRRRFGLRFSLVKTLHIETGLALNACIRLFCYLGLLWPISKLCNIYLTYFGPRFLRGINPDLVLVIYNPYSMQGFTDQLIREARKRNIKSVGIQMNWDNIANRCMFVRPDALGVIGWQSFMHARLYQNFPVEELQVLGNSYFSGYKLVQPITRSDLKSPQSGTPITIGIGPTNREHDEMFVLEEVLRSIKTGELPQTTRVILKPYGRSWQHYVDTFLKAGYKVQGITEFENFTFLAPPTNSNQTSDKTITQFEQVQDFFSKIDILVTPYSSLAVEAMLSKIPLVLLDYDPKQYGISHRHKWEVLLKGPHLEPLRINQSPIKCVSRNQLVDCITDALAKTQKNSIESNFKLASFLIEQPESSYADGLVKWLKSFN